MLVITAVRVTTRVEPTQAEETHARTRPSHKHEISPRGIRPDEGREEKPLEEARALSAPLLRSAEAA